MKRYTSTAELQDEWLTKIAPNYFDLDKINNYRSGVFGYINEVMSTVTMDTHNSINITRREFYPVTAQNPQSMNKMATLQHVGFPVATPGTCRAVLIFDEDEIIENSTYKNGNYTCIIDNTAEISADVIPFSILYPIVIISNKSNGRWNHTIHYDKSGKNDLDKEPSAYYLNHKTIMNEGKRYLMIQTRLYQVELESVTELVTTDALVQTVSMLFEFEGDLASFEVYYIEEPDVSTPVRLQKVMKGLSTPTTPFCQYTMLDSNLLELTFPKNIYFTPELNSEIRVDFYTSLGKGGEFDFFEGDLTCDMDSELYPYNNNMTMLGVLDGSCIGAEDVPSTEEYMRLIQDAYCTNHTITTTTDLQREFDRIANTSKNRVRFRKKRADIYREWGAYILLKDSAGNVVPTNSMSVSLKLDEFDTHNGTSQEAIIKPGALFEYDPKSDTSELYSAMRIDIEKEEEETRTDEEIEARLEDDTISTLTIASDLTEFDLVNKRFIYTNPFLIVATLYPNMIGYYNNSINETHSVDYEYINDESMVQFIGSNLKIYRNSMNKENFYRITLTISPTAELNPLDIIEIPAPPVIDEESGVMEENDYYFRAEQNGRVLSVEYSEEGVVECTIEYEDGETDTIQVSTTIDMDPNDPDEYIYEAGYSLTKDAYDTFVEGDILGVQKVKDLGKIRAGLTFKGILDTNSLYIPMAIEDYDEDLSSFTLAGYISTSDVLDNDNILIESGICGLDGGEDDDVSIPSTGLRASISVFYNYDDQNMIHSYSDFSYFRSHTMTNIYTDSDEEGISLVKPVTFIKSTLTFEEPDEIDDDIDDDGDDYIVTIHEMPLVKANWIKETTNFDYLIKEVMDDYERCKDLSFQLENNYSIDLKFYNTYGKSKFFRAGIKDDYRPLEHVNISFRFGAYLTIMGSQAAFLEKFRNYVKDKVEEINNTVGTAQSMYIMNLIHDIKENFSELGYLEYYGFDDYGYDIQKIEPVPISEMSDELKANYIPEFINVTTTFINGVNTPTVEVTFLDTIDEEQ